MGASGAVAVPLALLAAGCTIDHEVVVPTPVVERKALPPRVPAAIGVRYAPGTESAEWSWVHDQGALQPRNRWVLASGKASVALHQGLLPRLFLRAERVDDSDPPPERDLDAVLEISLADFEVSFPLGLGREPCRARVVHDFALRAPGRGELARWRVEGAGEQPAGFEICAGDAAAMALQSLGGSFAAGFRQVPGVEAWLAGVPPRAAGPEPGQGEAPEAAEPAPVARREPPPPRSVSLSAWVLKARPASTAGQFDEVGGGWGYGVDTAVHLSPHSAFEVSLEEQARSATSAHVALPQDPFAVFSDRIELRLMTVGLGGRAVLPAGPFDLWLGASLLVIHSDMKLGGSLIGFPGTFEEKERWAAGLRLAAGVDLEVAQHLGLALRFRWDRASADYGDLTGGSVAIGGPSVAVGAVLFWP